MPLKTILFMLIHGKDDDDDNNCFDKCLTIFSAVTIVKKIFSYDFSVENLVFIEMLT